MSLQATLSQGTIIGGHYVVDSLLNSGGFGAVYRGIDTSEGNRPCAIKETYDVTPAARRQALMETSVLLTVRNQHLPEVYDAFEYNGRFYLIMQLIEGQDLLQLLKSRVPGAIVGEAEPNQQLAGPCSEQEVLGWLLPIVDVLQDLHSRKPPIMHRDIKPGNLILTPQQTIVLVDFGLTKLYDPTRTTQTMVKAVTAGFSPLEQYLGQTSPRSDIYSMAATMYLLLTNRLPSAAVTRSMGDDLIAPRLLNPSLSPNVERALCQALTIHADQRYQSMSEFAQALRAPVFTAYADKTVAIAPPIVQGAQVPVAPSYAPVQATKPARPISPPFAYMGAQPGSASAANQPMPSKKQSFRWGQQKLQPTQPALPPGGSVSGYRMPPQAQGMHPPQRRAKSLPNASNQGCLWGALLGIGSALLIWSLRQEQAAGFYLALLVGFMCYLSAGFFTTRRGGNFLRGGKAGYWAGVTSLLLSSTALLIFLMIDFFQRLGPATSNTDYHHPGQNIRAAWEAVKKPVLPGILPDPFLNFITILVAIVVIAWLLGLIGGVMGSLKNSANVVNQPQQIPHP